MMKNKKSIVIVVSLLVATLLILVSFLIIHTYHNAKAKEYMDSYVVVKSINKDSIVVEDSNTKDTKTYITDGSNFHEGDLVNIQSEGNKIKDYKVIVEDYAKMTTNPIVVVDPTTTTTTTVVTTNNTTTTNTTTTVKKTTVKSTTVVKTTTKRKVSSKDETILKQVESDYKTIKNSSDNSTTFKEYAKKKFIELVDFIYYGKEINGITYKELKDSTKAKVLYYTLLLDAAIDTKFPGYKDNISDKYKDIKAKLIAEFLDIKYEVCQKSGDDCAQVDADFKLLKKSLKLTWDVIKGCFTYVKNLTVPKIKSWYESFRG